MTLDPDDLDIPMGGCLDQVVLTLAHHLRIEDPLEWFDRVVDRVIVRDDNDRLLLDLVAIDLESSTQIPHIREGMRLALAEAIVDPWEENGG